MATIHIIGAGIAGLAAATELARTPHRICLYEATTQAGGRCRSYHDPVLNRVLDNGNHLLLACNKQALELIEKVEAAQHWQAQPQAYLFHDIASRRQWRAKPGPAQLRHFTHSALNTPWRNASRQMVARTLWRTMRRKGWVAHLPTVPLQQALIEPMLNYVHRHHHSIYYQHALKAFEMDAQSAISSLRFGHTTLPVSAHDAIILATPSWVAQSLLPALPAPEIHEPIINGHFRFDAPDAPPLIGIRGGLAEWLFIKDGIIATTTSAASRHADMNSETIATQLWADVCSALGLNAPLPPHRILIEKRASFACLPAMSAQRPASTTTHPNLFLAGDYTSTKLPGCIEGAVQSGKHAAQLALKSVGFAAK